MLPFRRVCWDNPICIIVSHSGETFAHLACSNFLQGVTRDIFVVTSEWDTQIGKQLRLLYDSYDIISSCIFSTECGTRAAEPCSLTVVATHQLFTQIYGIICLAILKNIKYREYMTFLFQFVYEVLYQPIFHVFDLLSYRRCSLGVPGC